MLRKLSLVTVALMFCAHTTMTIAEPAAATKTAQSAQNRVKKGNDKKIGKTIKKQGRGCPANETRWCIY